MSPYKQPLGTPLELWGGFECSIVQIGDRFRNQIKETGHSSRTGDLDAVADMGFRTLRYPCLWEAIAPAAPDECDWNWQDRQMRKLRGFGVRPILGLVHHGSGPAYTDLLSEDFASGLAAHARRVVERYPWVNDFTPVNEPLTTARFSALYGHWYPHERSTAAFCRSVINQVRATVLAMREIRKVNPAARLVQTEDVGRIFSVPGLAYQAEYENQRRWLTLDLLFGHVNRHHPWFSILRHHGIGERQLDELSENPCPPDIVAVDYYLTSDRYLDSNTDRHDRESMGGNGRQVYADVAAFRMEHLRPDLGARLRLKETWERYRTPVIIGECHNGCTPEEQVRWLDDVWRQAAAARTEGVDVRAVTMWALGGTMDWNSLLTCMAGHYEAGALASLGVGTARETSLACAARQLLDAGQIRHPVLDTPGWWGRKPGEKRLDGREILIISADVSTQQQVQQICQARGLASRAVDWDALKKGNLSLEGLWAVLVCGYDAQPDRAGHLRQLMDTLAQLPMEFASPETAPLAIGTLVEKGFIATTSCNDPLDLSMAAISMGEMRSGGVAGLV